MGVTVTIHVQDGPDKGLSYELLEGECRVGRGRGDLKLQDKKVSGQHAIISIEGSRVFFEDLNSTNGSFVSGRKVDSKIEIQNLDRVTVGLTTLQFAVVEDVAEFKTRNSHEAFGETSRKSQASIEVAMPDPDAEYRDTGVQRIENLIEDELESFSKWDHPSDLADSQAPESIPQVKVILQARKAPDGVSQLSCSQAVTSLGRKDVDIRINDLDLSRKHAQIEIIGGTQVFVRDLASTNGTYVNGNRVSHQALKTGDLLQIGQSVFEILIKRSDA